MQQTGFQLPTFVFGNGIVTGVNWNDVNNILLVDGDVAVSDGTSDFTIGYLGNINIPQGSIITGIEIKVIGYRGAQTIPNITLTLSAYDNDGGADIYYPYTSGFTGLTETLAEYILGSSAYLFSTTWTVDMINNFKLNLEANGDISLDSVLVNVYYIPAATETLNYNTLTGTFAIADLVTGFTSGATGTIVTDNGIDQMMITGITGLFIAGELITGAPSGATALIDATTPGVCIDCSSPIQVQAMYLELPFLAGETKFYLKKGSFAYPDGTPVQPGDVGSCGGTIPFVFDESKRKADGQNFEENAMLDTNNGGTWTVLPSGVIEVDLGFVTQRGLDFKSPGTHVANLMSNHDANSKVIISNNEPYNLTLVRRCQADTVFSPPITVQDKGVTRTTSLHLLNFNNPYVAATLVAPHEIEITYGFQFPIQFQDQGVDLGTSGTVLTINFIGTGVTATRVGDVLTVNVTGGGGGGGHTIEVDGIAFPDEAALNFTNFFIGTDVPGVSTDITLDTAAIANDNTFITTLLANSTFITAIINITGAGGAAKVDQTPDNGTYSALAGAVNGSNTTFTVSIGSYVSGSLVVFLNGLIQLQGAGDDWTETTPGSGTFDFDVAPLTGDIITAIYQVPGSGFSVTNGIVAPISTPARIGDEYVDTVAKKIYFATGTSSSADWTIVN